MSIEFNEESFGEQLDFNAEWKLLGKLPTEDKERLAFYDKLFVEAYLHKVKLELVVLNCRGFVASKRQIVTYDQKLS
ncbi:hypothetical protein ES703_63439 [subsurface metagenome]